MAQDVDSRVPGGSDLRSRGGAADCLARVRCCGKATIWRTTLDHDEAVAVFTQAIREAPDDPGAYRGIAAITWLRILFLQGRILVDNNLSSAGRTISRRRVRTPKPPADLSRTFESHIERAVTLSEAAVRRAPDDADAHYELGASVAVAASYKASIEGDALRALREAKQAYTAHQTVLELDPRRKDAALTLGLYRYLVSLLPRAFRMLAYLVGFDGGQAEALRLIEEAAAYPGETRPEAQFALVLLYNREREYGGAQRVLSDLKRRFPQNRLLWLESAATWLRDERAVPAERAIDAGFAALAQDDRARMEDEQAVWHLTRGARGARPRRRGGAGPRRGRSRPGRRLGQGTGPHRAGQDCGPGGRSPARAGGVRAYDRDRRLCRQARHRRCADAAERLKRHGYPPQD